MNPIIPSSWHADWSNARSRLLQKYPQLTAADLHFVEGREDELITRLQQRTGDSRAAVESILRAEEIGPAAGAGDGLDDDAGLRGSGIPENTSHSGMSGL